MKISVFFTTSLLIYMTEAYQLRLPDELMRRRRSTSKPLNISQTEHETKMREYQRATRGTDQQRGYEPIAPIETQPQANGDIVLKFSSPNLGKVEDILLKMLVNSASHISIHQITGSGEVEIKSKDLSNTPLWVDAHLNIEPEITVRISCGPGCKIEYPTINTQYELLQGSRAGGEPIPKRLVCPPGADSSSFCCLTELRVKFQDLEPQGLDHLFAPIFYDASYCGSYSCGDSVENHYSFVKRYVTHIDGKLPATECSPNNYKPITVLTVHPDNDELLVVSVWEQAVALSCGCY